MIINNNIPALNTHRQMGINQGAAQKAMEKLSSGMRINKAGDDAAGLAISEKMRAQVRGLDQASRNSQDGISLIQTAEGSLGETQNILQRMRELATQAANGTNTESDRNEIQKEINDLTSEINRIGNTTEFNTQKLLNGEKAAAVAGVISVDADAIAQGIEAGDNLTIAGTNIDINLTDISAKELAAAINEEGIEGFTASVKDGNLIITQNAGFESAAALEVRIDGVEVSNVETAGVKPGETIAGEYKIDLSDVNFTDNGEIVIDGQKFEIVGGTTDEAALALAILANEELSEKYNITNNNDVLTFEQNSGFESATGLDVQGQTIVVDETTAGVNTPASEGLKFQIGANENQSMSLFISDMRAAALGITTAGTEDSGRGVTDGTNNDITEQALDVSTHEGAAAAITAIQNAIDTVSGERSKLGATQNRLEHTISNLNNSSENLSAAESRIRDVDMAKEVMEMTRANILSQASQAMLAQANQAPQSVLQLLG
ncbi:flagellin [Jeotgalibacillus marinus]|uniref:Flagellin n=1 Tax=Jeotgalibacillus marinus TaxID=86667 RepID=A0ABV3Q4Q0_9BACL